MEIFYKNILDEEVYFTEKKKGYSYEKYCNKLSKEIKNKKFIENRNNLEELEAIPKDYQAFYNRKEGCSYFISVTKKSPDEINFARIQQYFLNNHNFLIGFLLKLMIIKRSISHISFKIISSLSFELFSLIIILINCFTIVLINTKSKQFINWKPILFKIEEYCFYFYCFELLIKFISMGIFFGKNTYFRDLWNVFDFIIIFPDIVIKFLKNTTFLNIRALRAIRVLKPLRTITRIKKLQLILSALFSALPLLADSFLILIFFYLLFAVAGLQLFQGVLKKQCFEKAFGIPSIIRTICGNIKCPNSEYVCGKMLDNPNYGINSFDNIFYAFFNVFQIVTMDGWTGILYMVQRSFTNFISIYFIVIIILGSFFLVNLMLAIIKVKFSENHSNLILVNTKNKDKVYDLKVLKFLGLWKRNPKKVKIEKKKSSLMKKSKNSTYSGDQLFKARSTIKDNHALNKFTSIIKWTRNLKHKLGKLRHKNNLKYDINDYSDFDFEFMKAIVMDLAPFELKNDVLDIK